MAHLYYEVQVVVGILCVVALLSPSCLATVYTVGGPRGWTTPSRANFNYTDWAATTPFQVGDSLEFNYVYKAHTVLEVTRSDFRYCNKSNPIMSFADMSGKTVVVLAKPGSYYFIDGVGKHCEEGQKFQAMVAAQGAPEPSAEPSASPAMPPRTSDAPAPSSLRALVLILAALFVATFCLQ